MPNLTSDQEKELTFVTGVNADGTVAAQSFWTWNHDTPGTFGSTNNELKWGAPTAGTGATISFAFDPAANWSASEQGAFLASMHLWSAVANIGFVAAETATSADLVFQRGTDGMAETGLTPLLRGVVGTSQLGTMAHARVSIDTSVAGFGPLGGSFKVAAGYPWATALHEIGHAIGLGHGGLYQEGVTTSDQPYTPYDNTAWTVMSYIEGDDLTYGYSGRLNPGFVSYAGADGSPYVPQTIGMLDMLAVERLYGMPTDTPLSGGQIFGFNSNIDGDLGLYYDFARNPHPIVTLWDAGGNNTLDLSGFSDLGGTHIDLHQGAFSSAGANLSSNISIAYGTRIDTAIGTIAQDHLTANDDGDVLMGGGANDILTGGKGNDHIYGNMATTVQGAPDGADTIDAGDGSNYVNGNAGDDQITAGNGTNRLYGGAGNDQIIVNGHGNSHINGNTGDDFIQVHGGTNDIHGGQGNDNLGAFGGNNHFYGDAGNDVISGGTGINIMTGGAGADIFAIGYDGAPSSPTIHDEITDFTDAVDKFQVPNSSYTPVTPEVFHGDGRSFADIASAEAYADQLLAGTIGVGTIPGVAALEVGSDTYLFFSARNRPLDHIDTYTQVDHTDAATINQDDFVWSLNPLP